MKNKNKKECSTIITHWRHCELELQADSCQRFIFQNAHALLFKLFLSKKNQIKHFNIISLPPFRLFNKITCYDQILKYFPFFF